MIDLFLKLFWLLNIPNDPFSDINIKRKKEKQIKRKFEYVY